MYMRHIKINRRLLKTAVAIDILAFVIFFIFKLDERNWILLTPALAALLFFVALKFPDMACSKVLAGICTFMVITAVMIGPMLFVLGVLAPYSAIESSLFHWAFLAFVVVVMICAWMSAAEAVSWIRELREKKKAADVEEGIDSMTRGVIKFLRPRLGMFLVCFALFAAIPAGSAFGPRLKMDTFSLVLELLSGLISLLILVVMLFLIWRYNRYIKGLKASGVLSQAAMEFYKGNVYCEGHVVLGMQYIFVEGEGTIYEYDDFVKYFHKWSEAGRVHYWFLYAVKKDGTEIQLFELPYARTKKNYYEYVYPLINEIRIKSKDIAMEGPGEFYK